MEKVRGIVLELERGQAVILTPGGEFKKVPVKGPMPRIGEEIQVTLPTVGKLTRFNRLLATVAAALLLLVLSPALLSHFNQPSPAIAYVTIDINPSLELGIDENQTVVETRPLNKDGKRLLTGIKLEGLKITQAVKKITSEAVNQGFIAPEKENAVIVSLAPVQEEKTARLDRTTLENQLQETVEKTLETKNLTAVITTLEVDSALREKALEVGLSSGKYAIMLKAQEAGVPLTPDDLKETPVVAALKEAGTDMASVVGTTYLEPVRVLLVEREKEVRQEKPTVALKENGDQGEEKPEISFKETAPAAGEPATTRKVQIIKPRLFFAREKVKPATKDNVYNKAYEEPQGNSADTGKQEPQPGRVDPGETPDPILLEPSPDPKDEPKPDPETTPSPAGEAKSGNGQIIIKPPRNPQ